MVMTYVKHSKKEMNVIASIQAIVKKPVSVLL